MSYLDKIEVQIKETKPQNILYIREIMSTKNIADHIAKLFQAVQQENLTIAGAPMNVYHFKDSFNPDAYDNEVAIPIKETIEGTRQLPGGPCAMVTLKGPYTELTSAYAKLQDWVEKEKYTLSSEPYEVYVTDPGITAPDKNITEIYYPINK